MPFENNSESEKLEEWRQEILDTFARVKEDTEPYLVTLDGVEIVVYPNVFSPKYFTDSLWFAQKVREVVKKGSLLEIGTGTGITALFSGLAGAKVVATDINPDAAANAQENFQKHNIEGEVRYGDMYTPIKEGKKFDVIFWNHPFNKWPEPVDDVLLRAGLDYNYEGLTRYVKEARKFLNEGGKLLLGTGSFADHKEIKRIAESNNFRLSVVEESAMPATDNRSDKEVMNSYIIYELTDQD